MGSKSSDLDLREILETEARFFIPKAQAKGIVIKCVVHESLPRRLRGEGAKIRELLHHLFDNAVKFTRAGRVAVSATREKDTSTHLFVRISVEDTGIGIAPEAQRRLFEPFYQADEGIKLRYGGVGLGLALSRHLVEQMEGRIGVESAVGRGTTFWCLLPFEKPVEAAGLRPAAAPPARFPVLLASTDQALTSGILRELAGLGYEADVVAGVAEALEARERVPYGLVVIDLSLEGGEGLRAVEEIRRLENFSFRLPLIGLDSRGDASSREKCLAAGASVCWEAPLKPGVLSSCLRQWDVPLEPEVLAELRRIDQDGFLRKIVALFYAEAPKLLPGLKRTSAASDGETVAYLAHKLKGISANVGAKRLRAVCAAMENLARAGSLSEAASLAGLLEEEYRRAQEALRAEVGEIEPASEADIKAAIGGTAPPAAPPPLALEETSIAAEDPGPPSEAEPGSPPLALEEPSIAAEESPPPPPPLALEEAPAAAVEERPAEPYGEAGSPGQEEPAFPRDNARSEAPPAEPPPAQAPAPAAPDPVEEPAQEAPPPDPEPPKQEAPPTPLPRRKGPRALKAVVCDDDRTLLFVMHHLLLRLHFAAFAAEDGKQGLALIRKEDPCLLVLDVDMPEKDGLSLLKELPEETRRGMYIVVLTNFESDAIHSQARALDVQEVLVKPIVPADFTARIERLVREGVL